MRHISVHTRTLIILGESLRRLAFARACCASKTTMAGVIRRVRNLYKLLLLSFILVKTACAVTYIDEESPSDCTKLSDAEFHEFYDISQLRCEKCAQTSTFQTVSKDGEPLASTQIHVAHLLTLACCHDSCISGCGHGTFLCTYF